MLKIVVSSVKQIEARFVGDGTEVKVSGLESALQRGWR